MLDWLGQHISPRVIRILSSLILVLAHHIFALTCRIAERALRANKPPLMPTVSYTNCAFVIKCELRNRKLLLLLVTYLITYLNGKGPISSLSNSLSPSHTHRIEQCSQ